ncbi:MAG: hypothetical protein WCC64_22950 [Aliidongia sp.]
MTNHDDPNEAGALSRREILLGTAALSTSLLVSHHAHAVGAIYKYDTPTFSAFINSLYASADQMQTNVETLTHPQTGKYTKSPGRANSIQAIKWGDYQPVLAPLDTWPGATGERWVKSAAEARNSLMKVANTDPVDDRYPTNIPKTRCDLLDALVQKCFNTPAAGQTKPGIPMAIDVTEKPSTDANRDLHDIVFHWESDADGKPTLLYLTMVCAYQPPKRVGI